MNAPPADQDSFKGVCVAVLQLSQTNPQIYDLPYLHRQMIETMGIKNAAKIIPDLSEQKPLDPVTENMNLMNGKPDDRLLSWMKRDVHTMFAASKPNARGRSGAKRVRVLAPRTDWGS